MTDTTELLKNRIYIDFREDGLIKGDLVTISNRGFLWKVTRVSKDGITAHLQSVIGGRYGNIITSRVKSVWRDPLTELDTDWTTEYPTEVEQ